MNRASATTSIHVDDPRNGRNTRAAYRFLSKALMTMRHWPTVFDHRTSSALIPKQSADCREKARCRVLQSIAPASVSTTLLKQTMVRSNESFDRFEAFKP
jgi:hypothetical protein